MDKELGNIKVIIDGDNQKAKAAIDETNKAIEETGKKVKDSSEKTKKDIGSIITEIKKVSKGISLAGGVIATAFAKGFKDFAEFNYNKFNFLVSSKLFFIYS